MDRYQQLRDLPFPVIAQVLGIDVSKFRERKGGTELSGPCPVHRGKRSNTAFSYAQNGAWHCFSCSEKGKGAIDLAMKVQGIGFQAAVDLLTPYAGSAVQFQAAKIPEPRVTPAVELPTENPPFKSTYEKFFKPHPWLEARGIKSATLEHYDSGYYENPARRSVYNGSVMLKIRRWSDGETTGYLSRNIGEVTSERPKYRFPEGLQKQLEVFSAVQLREDHQLPLRIVYVLESPFACMAFYQLSLPAVSCFGWHISPQQADIINQLARGVVFLPDRDKWEEAAPSVHQLAKRLWVKMPQLPEGADDPEHLNLEQIKSLT